MRLKPSNLVDLVRIKYNGPEPHLINMLHFAKIWTRDHKFTDDKPHGQTANEVQLEEEGNDDEENEFYKKTIIY